MACAGCQKRRELLGKAVQHARQGNFVQARQDVSQMAKSIIGRGPNSRLSTKPPAPGQYKLRLTPAAQEVYHLTDDGRKDQG
jgi:hypothetical protein